METQPDLKKQPETKDVLVITDHFTRYSLAFATKDQKASTVAKVLYERFIALFGAPRRLLSDQGANFTSKLVEELCRLFETQKCRTTAYHPEGNGQVERFNGTLCRMIGKKFNEGGKWLPHLPEICQAYNATRSAVTGYSPHYLMFGRRPRLPVDFNFPTLRSTDHPRNVPDYVQTLRDRLSEASSEAKRQAALEAERQKRSYDRNSTAVQLEAGDVVLVKLDAAIGKRKLKNRWSEVPHTVLGAVSDGIPVYEIQDPDGRVVKIHRNRLLLVKPVRNSVPLCAPTQVHEPDHSGSQTPGDQRDTISTERNEVCPVDETDHDFASLSTEELTRNLLETAPRVLQKGLHPACFPWVLYRDTLDNG